MLHTKDLIEQIEDQGHSLEIMGQIKSGKEGTVYRALFDGKAVALKAFHEQETNSFKNNSDYTEANHFKEKSFNKAILKKSKFGKKAQFSSWVEKEFAMLELLYESGAKVPKPLLHHKNIVIMELIGDSETVAPRLQDFAIKKLPKEVITKMFEEILKIVDTLLEAGYVHGDLSSYNILIWHQTPYVIDFPQVVDVTTNLNATKLFMRDLLNITEFFGRYITIDTTTLINKYAEILHKHSQAIHDEQQVFDQGIDYRPSIER